MAIDAGFIRVDPDTLLLTISADGGSRSVSSLGLVDAGLYAGFWQPMAEGTYSLVAVWPDAGIASAPNTVTVDWTPPTISIQVGSPPPRPDANFEDPNLPGAWRRDEFAPVTVISSEPINGQVFVFGIADGGTQPTFFDAGPSECDAGFCLLATVDLAAPIMNAFDGMFSVGATVIDRAGNSAGVGDAGIPVTRWKWVFGLPDGGARNPGAIGIGSRGTLYFSNHPSAARDSLYAVEPNGTLSWAWQADSGLALTDPVIGVDSSGEDRAYLSSTSPNQFALFALTLGSLDAGPFCVWDAGYSAETIGQSTPPGNNTPVETLFVALPNGILAARPDAIAQNAACTFFPMTAPDLIGFPRPLVGQGNGLVYSADAGIVSVRLDSSFVGGERWDTTWFAPLPNGARFAGLLGYGSSVVAFSQVTASRTSMVQQLDGDSGTVLAEAAFTDAGLVESVVSSSGALVAYTLTSGGTEYLTEIDLDGGWLPLTFLPAAFGSTPPAVGAGGVLYQMDSIRLAAIAPSFDLSWASPYGQISLFTEITLDCSRATDGSPSVGRPGVLYYPSKIGVLAVITDSRGVAVESPWPLAAHDPRRTNNQSTSVGQFACP